MSVPAYLLVPEGRRTEGAAVLACRGHGPGKSQAVGLESTRMRRTATTRCSSCARATWSSPPIFAVSANASTGRQGARPSARGAPGRRRPVPPTRPPGRPVDTDHHTRRCAGAGRHLQRGHHDGGFGTPGVPGLDVPISRDTRAAKLRRRDRGADALYLLADIASLTAFIKAVEGAHRSGC